MTPEHITLQPGDRVGHYEIQRILGTGGFGVTYLAIEMNLNREVVIREYFPATAYRLSGSYDVHARTLHDQQYAMGLKRFLEEARIIVRFNHINVVRTLAAIPAICVQSEQYGTTSALIFY